MNIAGTVAFEFGKPNFLERRSYPDERRVQIADTATLLWNTHLIKFGIDFNRTHDTLDNLFQEGGVFTYTSRADFISDYEPNTKLGRVGRFYTTFAQGIGPTAFSFATMDFAGFIQDAWHVQPSVTVNWGLRYDLESMPSPQIATRWNRGPACFRVTRTTGVRASASTGTSRGRATRSCAAATGCSTAASSTRQSPTPSRTPAWRLASSSPTISPSATAPAYPNILANASASPVRPNIVFFGSGTQNPLIHQFDIIFDQRIAANTVLSVPYIGSQGRNLPIFFDQNLNPATAPTPSRHRWAARRTEAHRAAVTTPGRTPTSRR